MYGGAPEPQTAQDAPWLHEPSLKTLINGLLNSLIEEVVRRGRERHEQHRRGLGGLQSQAIC